MDTIRKPRNVIEKSSELPFVSLLVKQERLKLGLSQVDLSKQVGLGLKTLRKIEQGDLNINYERLNYLLHFFGMSLRPVELITSPPRKKKVILDRDYILKILHHFAPVLKLKYNVVSLALFGSYAKECATESSDIDILISFSSVPSFEVEGEIELILENLFGGIKVDLTLEVNLHGSFVKEIKESCINVI